ncbi:putative sterigmatocystin biosynthesis P450 monooxygenase stcS [Colletotrichum trifolii]|uniref:Putative sterigmatocystin biosynthesis P450 monooxygenase stcS n=1 Tax=Colletotrichum trifolii TaxID=5466 RepID=A0A4R8RC71_COLTR|nr:putative sterigmatocystin biosynthesis P450 monooxygenase stcS [Colletotrichum trifolii]
MALLGYFDKLNVTALLQWKFLLVAAIPLAVVIYLKRSKPEAIDIKQFSHFPQPEEADPKRGHWPWIEKAAKLGDPRRSFDELLYEQAKKLNFPPVLLVDWRPVQEFVLLFILDNEVAEQVTRPTKMYGTSVPKHPALQHLAPLVGARSLVTTDGDEWKGLRKRILPGMQPRHLLSLVQVVLDKTQLFIDFMEEKAATGEEFTIDEYTTNLAFDVIGIVTFDMDLNAQVPGKQSKVLTTYRELSYAFVKREVGKHWLRTYFSKNERKIRRLDKELDGILKQEITRQHKAFRAGDAAASRSVAALSLHGIDELTPEILQSTSDTCRGFLFAGHDTTSILLQWCFYLLHIRPVSAEDLKKELDEVFGPDSSPKAVMDQLSGPDAGKLLARLPYTDAVIKEALRLHPPGTTARVAPKGSNYTLSLPDGRNLVVDNLCLSPRAYIIQRDAKIFGETKDEFRPERWLGEEGAKVPDSAFRPYERGPRRCTGSELANLETKIVLACIARHFEFVKVGLGELDRDEKGLAQLDERGYYKTKGRLFSTDLVTSKPVDGMKLKVELKNKA